MKDFAALILTHGRPEKVLTYDTLRKCGYTGKIYIIIDDLDKKREEYIQRYKDEVIIFDKKAIAKTFDTGDNFDNMKTIVYARNASFEIAKNLGLKNFIQLDDDYGSFQYRFNPNYEYEYAICTDLDSIFASMVKFQMESGADAIAMAQGGDFIGGDQGAMAQSIKLKRKCMNSFVCSTSRPFKFVGRINEDVNTYTRLASTGLLLFTTNQISLGQLQTQTNSGGMTETYLESGTYIKSFYSVMYMPSAVRVKVLNDRGNSRLHHSVSWRNAVPKILPEELKKTKNLK